MRVRDMSYDRNMSTTPRAGSRAGSRSLSRSVLGMFKAEPKKERSSSAVRCK